MKCKTVWVRFAHQNHNGQHITAGDVDACTHLVINHIDVQIFSIDYMVKDKSVKNITFNFNHMIEYSLERFVD